MTEPALVVRRYEGKSVLVAGGTGFIGTHLSRQLVASGAEVAVLGRHAIALPEGVELVLGDVRSEAAVTPLIARRFDYVFNLAAYSGQVPSFTDHEQSLTTKIKDVEQSLTAKIKDGEQGLTAKIDGSIAEVKVQIAQVKGELVLVRWMLGVLVGGVVAVLIRLFLFRGPV